MDNEAPALFQRKLIRTDYFAGFPRAILAVIHAQKRIALRSRMKIERFHSRGQQPCKFIGTKESDYIRKEFNSHRIGLVHQHARRFIVLEHQYGCRDVMYKHKIKRDIYAFLYSRDTKLLVFCKGM
jgi:hypothetical protein